MNAADEIVVPLIVVVAMGLFALVCCAATTWFAVQAFGRGSVFRYQPRRRVPWRLGAVVLTLLYLSLALLGTVFGRLAPPPANPVEISSQKFADQVFAAAGFHLVAVAGIILFLMVVLGATFRDIGFPTSAGGWLKDTGLGLALGFAGIIPVYVVQGLSIGLLEVQASHPILDRIRDDPNIYLLLSGMLAAMMVAPLFEELMFRSMFQGALERVEDEAIDWPWSKDESSPQLPEGEHVRGNAFMGWELEVSHASVEEDQAGLIPIDDAPPENLAGITRSLRHGWAPVLTSSFLFALAHLGQGPSPVPLFFFALMLGYTFQRTHRIVPCIVAHFVFNGVSLAMLCLTIAFAPEAVP